MSITATNGQVLTYKDLLMATRQIQYPGYGLALARLRNMNSDIERVFSLQRSIDHYEGTAKAATLKQVLKDLQDGSIQLHSVH